MIHMYNSTWVVNGVSAVRSDVSHYATGAAILISACQRRKILVSSSTEDLTSDMILAQLKQSFPTDLAKALNNPLS